MPLQSILRYAYHIGMGVSFADDDIAEAELRGARARTKKLMLETATEVHQLRDKRPAYVRDNPDWHMLNARN